MGEKDSAHLQIQPRQLGIYSLDLSEESVDGKLLGGNIKGRRILSKLT